MTDTPDLDALAALRAEIAERHQPITIKGQPFTWIATGEKGVHPDRQECAACEVDWPCDAASLADTVLWLIERARLGQAWEAAVAVAEREEGWQIRGLAHGSPMDENEWVAGAGPMPFWRSSTEVRGNGPTPAAALLSLAAKLAER